MMETLKEGQLNCWNAQLMLSRCVVYCSILMWGETHNPLYKAPCYTSFRFNI